ncbi:MAG: peptidase domain-containing ABC transporter [Rhodobacteraceae bacterium]|jgi:ATP-binding cassette subfamily B protein RaxB|nr:peptidase domain-containing ABC transporter [Paracoccaceae bacterium]
MPDRAEDPLQTGVALRPRIRLVRQNELAECGLACLAMVVGYHGLDTDLATLRRRFPPSPRGTALRTLMEVADRLELVTRPVKLPLDKLGQLKLPAILHWDLNHFVVLERVSRGRALIHDPAGRSRWMPLAELSDHFTGVALELAPGDAFVPARERVVVRLSTLWGRLRGLGGVLGQVLILSLVMQAFVLALPYYTQLAIDKVLPAGDRDLLLVLAMGFGMFLLVNVGAGLLRGFILLAAGSRLGFGISSNVARRLFRLPVDWFDRRETGDILSRFQSVGPIQQALVQGAMAAVLDGFLAVTTLVLLFVYSPTLAMVAIVALLFYGAVRYLSFSAERAAEEALIVTAGKEQTTLIETVQGIAVLRLTGREMARHTLWQARLADRTNASIHIGRIGIWQSTANSLIFGIENIVTIYLAVSLVLSGGFSVGMVFAYLAYKAQFLERSGTLVEQLIDFAMLRLHLERLSDITDTEEDRSFTVGPEARTDLKGAIELREVSYRYAPTEPFVLQAVNLRVGAGEHVAITGPSGVGKTTLLKVMTGLIAPESGEVLVDGVPIEKFGLRSFHEQISVILQDDVLFTGSIAANIAFLEDAPDMEQVAWAAATAAIHDEIMAMPMRYETLVGDLGSTLSGGQKQRVLLARALYRRPRMLIMDEGTAHLDAANEARVNAAIAALGITRVIVAHRRETVAAADRVIDLGAPPPGP